MRPIRLVRKMIGSHFHRWEALRLKAQWMRKMSRISDGDWTTFRANSKDMYNEGRWWNLGWYIWKDPGRSLDGSVMQTKIISGNRLITEIPDDRRLGFPSLGRFACSGGENCWLAADYEIAVAESIQSGKYGFPVSRGVVPGTWILDVSHGDCAVLQTLEKLDIIDNREEFFSILCSNRPDKEREIYPITHAIADSAHAHGYKGILFRSAEFQHISQGGISDFNCLVVFEKSVLLE